MIAAITAGLSVLAIILEMVVKYRSDPKREQEQRYAESQRGRQGIADGDVAAVNARIDRLLDADNDITRQSSGEVTAGRIDALCGVVDPGGSPGADTGKS